MDAPVVWRWEGGGGLAYPWRSAVAGPFGTWNKCLLAQQSVKVRSAGACSVQ